MGEGLRCYRERVKVVCGRRKGGGMGLGGYGS